MRTWNELSVVLHQACICPCLPAIRRTDWKLMRNGSYVSEGSQRLAVTGAQGRAVILWLNKATAELTGDKTRMRVRLRWLQGLISTSSSAGTCCSTNPQSPLPPLLNNVHIVTTVMWELTLVQHVSYCTSRVVRESVPQHGTLVITKKLMAHEPFLFLAGFWGKTASSCWNPKASN